MKCAHCGKAPLRCQDDQGDTVQVDACFKGALPGDWGVSGCCGHGDRSKAYVRLMVRKPDGTQAHVDLCGFVVQSYGHFLEKTEADRKRWNDWKPPLNIP